MGATLIPFMAEVAGIEPKKFKELVKTGQFSQKELGELVTHYVIKYDDYLKQLAQQGKIEGYNIKKNPFIKE